MTAENPDTTDLAKMVGAPKSDQSGDTFGLLPCPFCGEKKIYLNPPNEHDRFGSINCPACMVILPGALADEEELIQQWNTRTPPTSPAPRMAALEEAARIAAFLLARDDAGSEGPSRNEIEWASRTIYTGMTAAHSGDCTNECHSCIRCQADRALRDATAIRALIPQGGQAAVTVAEGWHTDMENTPRDGTEILVPIEFKVRAFWDDEAKQWLLSYPLNLDYVTPTKWLTAAPSPTTQER